MAHCTISDGIEGITGALKKTTEQGVNHITVTKKKHFHRFQQVLDYIDVHYAENLTLDSVAEYGGFSRYYFSRLFKQLEGVTPLAFRQQKYIV